MLHLAVALAYSNRDRTKAGVHFVVQVEEYMTDIIYKMRGDLREILHQSVVDYPSKAREKWIFDWPSQIILVVNQIFWCQEVEEAFMNLNKGKVNALKVRRSDGFECSCIINI